MLKKTLLFLFILTMVSCQKSESNTNDDNSKNNKGDAVQELLNLGENEILVATIKTNLGNMEVELFPKQTPKTVENFVGLASKDYYNGIIFHRIIANFWFKVVTQLVVVVVAKVIGEANLMMNLIKV